MAKSCAVCGTPLTVKVTLSPSHISVSELNSSGLLINASVSARVKLTQPTDE